MPDYRRWRIQGGSYFFTVNLMNRSSRLLVEHVGLLREAFGTVRRAHPFHIDAIVILPEHLHAVWTLPAGDTDYSTRWRLIKSHFSRGLPSIERRSASRRRQHERGIWQRRFYEHTLRDENDFAQHVDYIHYNPVKHGHVMKPTDWAFSSLHRYIQRGIVEPGWGTSGVGTTLDLG
ncbi:MAG: transposase [Phycisphaeraceae bacterium]